MAPTSEMHSQIASLRAMIRDAIADGRLDAQEIANQRSREHKEIVKMIRFVRSDGEEFALQLTGQSFRLWSSVAPSDVAPGLIESVFYARERSRHSNLNSMPRLRGPKRDGTIGSAAWKLVFRTPADVLEYLLCKE